MAIKNTEIYELVKTRLQKEFEVPESYRDKLWNEVEYDSNGIVLYERRPHFQNSEIITKSPIFNLKYHSGTECWSVFWMPSDMKWHKLVEYKRMESVIKYIKENGECFWG